MEFAGSIDSFERLGDVYKYEGTILCPGTWKGIDGHEITYSAELPEVLQTAASTFVGTQLVDGHLNQTRSAVKGFNSSAWYGDDGCIHNVGYIFDPDIIAAINSGDYPVGQSMEARVLVDETMTALRIIGERVAIGITKPACKLARQNIGKEVKLSMSECKFAQTLTSALQGYFEGDDKDTKIAEIVAKLGEGMTVLPGDPKEKYIVLSDEIYATLKAGAEGAKKNDGLATEVKELKETLLGMVKSGQESGLSAAVLKIVALDGEFKSEEYLEGIEDHSIKMRMLNTYLQNLARYTPTIPQTEVSHTVKMEDAEEKDVAMKAFGMSIEDFIGKPGAE